MSADHTTPNPSQAAVLVKQFLGRNSVDIKLGMAQETVAIVKGYQSWNALAASEDPRGRRTKPLRTAKAIKSAAAPVHELWMVCGRVEGDDDDTMESCWAENEAIASEVFKQSLRSFRDTKGCELYITGATRIGRMAGAAFLLDEEHRPDFIETLQAIQPQVCRKCGGGIAHDGYCSDAPCPYNDWPQHVPVSDLETMSQAQIEDKYRTAKRAIAERSFRVFLQLDEKNGQWLWSKHKLAPLTSLEKGDGLPYFPYAGPDELVDQIVNLELSDGQAIAIDWARPDADSNLRCTVNQDGGEYKSNLPLREAIGLANSMAESGAGGNWSVVSEGGNQKIMAFYRRD